MAVHILLGLIAIEYALSCTSRMRAVDEKRDKYFWAFRRLDVTKWARWKLYPGALFTMSARLILMNIQGLILLICAK